jgi:signal peptidase II
MPEPEPAPTAEPPVPPAGRPRVGVLAAVAALVLGLDVLSKVLVVANLTEGDPVHILGDIFEFTLLRNPGAAFNVGTGYTVVFTVLAIGVIVFAVRTARRLRSVGYAVAFGLLLGGAAGNLGDRIFRSPGIFRGYVVDWIAVVPRYYPVFNIADSAICIAGATFIILALRGIHMDGTRADRATASPSGPPGDPASGNAATGHPGGASADSAAGTSASPSPHDSSPSDAISSPRASSAEAER